MSSLRALIPFLLIPFFTGFIGPAPKLQPPALVGVWVGGTDERMHYTEADRRTWREHYEADSELTIYHREYASERITREYAMHGSWWTQGNLLYTHIETIEEKGQRRPDGSLYVYELTAINPSYYLCHEINSKQKYRSDAATEASAY